MSAEQSKPIIVKQKVNILKIQNVNRDFLKKGILKFFLYQQVFINKHRVVNKTF